MQKQFQIYALCQPHTVAVSTQNYWEVVSSRKNTTFQGAGPLPNPLVFELSSLPPIPYVEKRSQLSFHCTLPSILLSVNLLKPMQHMEKYNFWRLAVSRLRARLAQVGEAPYVQSSDRVDSYPVVFSSPFSDILKATDFPLKPLPATFSSKYSVQNPNVTFSSSLWANQDFSLEGLCSFSRSISPPLGSPIPVLSPDSIPILLFPGSLLHYRMSGEGGSSQGDMMQWGDLLIALHLLGFGPHVHFPTSVFPCPSLPNFGLIFSDYGALLHPACGL